MRRRLYFLLPNVATASKLVEKLSDEKIARRHMHSIAGAGIDLQDLPIASNRQLHDMGAKVESWLWQANLFVFFLSLIVLGSFILLRLDGALYLIPAGLMLLTLGLGFYFALNVPHVHLNEFQDALKHHEILLLVDVPLGRVAEIEEFVHRNQVEAVSGGVGWSVDALQL